MEGAIRCPVINSRYSRTGSFMSLYRKRILSLSLAPYTLAHKWLPSLLFIYFSSLKYWECPCFRNSFKLEDSFNIFLMVLLFTYLRSRYSGTSITPIVDDRGRSFEVDDFACQRGESAEITIAHAEGDSLEMMVGQEK